MRKSVKILFHENGDPLDPRCIERFVWAFPRGYRKVVKIIIEKSERLDKEVFRRNIARLMPSFKMTRNPKAAFHGVKIDRKGAISDPKGVIDLCWKKVGEELLNLKGYINEKAYGVRNRTLANLSPASKDDVIKSALNFLENC